MQAISAGLKLALATGALLGLAACTTAPQPAPVVATAARTVTTSPPPPQSPAAGGLAGQPFEALPEQLISETPRSALLSGESVREFQRGGASWYGPGFHGRRTASGEIYDMNAMTAAHRTLPFGTWVRVKSLVNGREVDVRITDRGPFIRSRVIDVSRSAAEALGMLGLGFKEVVLMVPDSKAEVAASPVVKKRGVVRRVFKEK